MSPACSILDAPRYVCSTTWRGCIPQISPGFSAGLQAWQEPGSAPGNQAASSVPGWVATHVSQTLGSQLTLHNVHAAGILGMLKVELQPGLSFPGFGSGFGGALSVCRDCCLTTGVASQVLLPALPLTCFVTTGEEIT